MEPVKSPFLSKTLWTNVIMAVMAVFAVKWPAVSEYASADNVAYVFTFVNFILRFVTKDKISFS